MDFLLSLYHSFIGPGLWGLLYMNCFLLTLGILRMIYRYATAQDIVTRKRSGDHSSWVAGLVSTINRKQGLQESEDDPDDDFSHTIPPTDAHLGGAFIDMVLISLLLIVLIFLWPILLVSGAVFIPVQLSRNHFMKKRVFLNRLKGENK